MCVCVCVCVSMCVRERERERLESKSEHTRTANSLRLTQQYGSPVDASLTKRPILDSKITFMFSFSFFSFFFSFTSHNHLPTGNLPIPFTGAHRCRSEGIIVVFWWFFFTRRRKSAHTRTAKHGSRHTAGGVSTLKWQSVFKGVVLDCGERLLIFQLSSQCTTTTLLSLPCSWSNVSIGCNCLLLGLSHFVCFPFTEPGLLLYELLSMSTHSNN